VLFVSHVYPWPLRNGTQQRIFHLANAIAQKHDLTFFSITKEDATGGDAEEDALPLDWLKVIKYNSEQLGQYDQLRFRRSGQGLARLWTTVSSTKPNLVRRWESTALVQELSRLKCESNFDLVWVEQSFLADSVRKAGFKNIVLDVDGLLCRSLSRKLSLKKRSRSKQLEYVELVKLRRYEQQLVKRYSCIMICNPDDISFFKNRKEGQVKIIPNGTISYPRPDRNLEKEDQILFVGSMKYGPNVDAVRYFAQEIFPKIQLARPQASFHIVGSGFSESTKKFHDGKTIVYHGEVEDLDSYFSEASLFVCPLRGGNGTKLKVLEAMARGKAVVATSVGAEGIDLQSGKHFVVCDGKSGFATECVKLLADPTRRGQIADAGRMAVSEGYGWDAIGDQVNRIIQSEIENATSG